MTTTQFNSAQEILDDIRAGRMVILIDDEGRENEGDLILAADFITPQAINFMAREARGLICLSLTSEQIDRLGLPQMVRDDLNGSPHRTAFTVSIEAASGVSTGISAADRAHTVRVAANPLAAPNDIIMPGHVFPIRAQNGGVLKRAGHTEASVDLARMAGLNPAAVICEIMNEDGSMARVDDLKVFAQKHQLKIGTIEDLIEYRIKNESFVEEIISRPLDTAYGEGFSAHLFHNRIDGREHVAVVKGNVKEGGPVLVRVQTENVLSDVFGALHPQSGQLLRTSLSLINNVGRGILLYLREPDMRSMFSGHKPVMDQRDYGVGAQILRSLGVREMILVSNHPVKRVGLRGYGIEVVDCINSDGEIVPPEPEHDGPHAAEPEVKL
jgi:3,4-dihydroxy 2-butanone 4-phosphate synthase / GTP cyclohydrolase II